jgi:AraC family transcriptional regulator of adaptative response/methylated-DNA-[protein]-cysteine methyltransferase
MDTSAPHLPSRDEMLAALMARDASCDGLFFAAVTTTGVFCRPSCPSRHPNPGNVQFYATAREALIAGFRPCLRCHPLEDRAGTPEWAAHLIERVESAPTERVTEADLREEGLDPAVVRRYFVKTFGMTFQAYARARRLGSAFAALRSGTHVDDVVYGHGWESASGFREAFAKAAGTTPGEVAAPGAPADFIRLAWIDTPLGPMVAGATADAVCLLEFTDRRLMEQQLARVRARFGCPLLPGDSPLLDTLRDQLGEYFAGARRDFDVPIDYRGTDFQRRVWEGLLRIPYGETCSYADLAADIGQPAAARAVGHANGLNHISVVIPCHRVIAAGGSLGGYGGGLWRKLRLLETEGVTL